MPIKKAAKKAIRQNIKNKERNLLRKKTMKEFVKKIKDLSTQSKIDEAKKLLPSASKAIDKAAKAGLIKSNTASRKKAHIARITNNKKA